MRLKLLLAVPLLAVFNPAFAQTSQSKPAPKAKAPAIVKIVRSDAEWRKILTPDQYRVLRQKDTERAFSGKYWHNTDKGSYVCAACDLELFSSQHKFDSGTGWPSFWQPIAKDHIQTSTDHELGYERIEVHCTRCGGHLGHVFDDGPKPTGLRYCMNSVCLKFVKAEAGKK
jgi:peptide-methionine (R)-S-oxide reductase